MSADVFFFETYTKTMPTRRRKLSGGTFQNRKIRIGPRGGKYILKGGRKMYLSGGQACSKYRKTKDPKCEEQDGCQWVKGKGCTGRGNNKVAGKKASSRLRTAMEEKIISEADKLRRYYKLDKITEHNIETARRMIVPASKDDIMFQYVAMEAGKSKKMEAEVRDRYGDVNMTDVAKKYLYTYMKEFEKGKSSNMQSIDRKAMKHAVYNHFITKEDMKHMQTYANLKKKEFEQKKKSTKPKKSYKKDRPSPSESAKTYNLGTTKRGNDGKMWTVVANKNGVKRWKRN